MTRDVSVCSQKRSTPPHPVPSFYCTVYAYSKLWCLQVGVEVPQQRPQAASPDDESGNGPPLTISIPGKMCCLEIKEATKLPLESFNSLWAVCCSPHCFPALGPLYIMVQCVLHCSNVALCQFYVTQLIQQESKEQTALGRQVPGMPSNSTAGF